MSEIERIKAQIERIEIERIDPVAMARSAGGGLGSRQHSAEAAGAMRRSRCLSRPHTILPQRTINSNSRTDDR
jgi:hypothetical protein